jgi:hypothetical protein
MNMDVFKRVVLALTVVAAMPLAACRATPPQAPPDEGQPPSRSMDSHASTSATLRADIKSQLVRTMRGERLPKNRARVRGGRQHVAGVRQSDRRESSKEKTLGKLTTTSSSSCSGRERSTEGQTTFRLRHAYGSLGAWGAGTA